MLRISLWLPLLTACGSSAATPDAAADATSGISVGGVIHEWTMPGPTGTPLSGAQVCVHGTTRCVTTDANGAYALDHVDSASDWGITIPLANHMTTVILAPPFAQNLPMLNVGIISNTVGQQKVTAAGGTRPLAGTGIIEVGVYDATNSQPVSGATEALIPPAGHGPAYLGLDGRPDGALTSTSSEGGAMFVGVPAGSAVVGVTVTGKTCVLARDGWGGSSGMLHIAAEPDSLVFIGAGCQ